jgi:hypothetical protein
VLGKQADERTNVAVRPERSRTYMTSRAFWEVVDRLQLRDADALRLIDCPDKIKGPYKRPRFHLTLRQAWLAGCLFKIEAALQASSRSPEWLQKPNRAALFSGRAPIKLMTDRLGEGATEVLRFLTTPRK